MSEFKIITNKECDCCKLPTVRSAVNIDGISFCHECLMFLKTISDINKSNWLEEVEKQANYIKKSN